MVNVQSYNSSIKTPAKANERRSPPNFQSYNSLIKTFSIPHRISAAYMSFNPIIVRLKHG
ncbi:MAG TPA: hypothetical protein VFP49_03135 [Nitrososphaeraceae archaeon]|nr:hypothetical protein [Nitrososphaeraceae archaeon]